MIVKGQDPGWNFWYGGETIRLLLGKEILITVDRERFDKGIKH
jgi:hypothetical protein